MKRASHRSGERGARSGSSSRVDCGGSKRSASSNNGPQGDFHMRLKSILVAAGFSAFVAAFAASSAVAQEKKAAEPLAVCANCHERQQTTILLTGHGANYDAGGSTCQACHGDAAEHLKDPSKWKPV